MPKKKENFLKRKEYLAVWFVLIIEIIILVIAYNISIEIPENEREGIFYSERLIKILDNKCKDLAVGDTEEIPITLINEETYTLEDLEIEKAEIKKDGDDICRVNFIKNIKRDLTETITFTTSVQICITRNATGETTCY
jgi:hypothetical protein